MKKLAFAVLILSLSLGSCQTKYPELGQGVYAEFDTNKGIFVAELYNDATPLTVANFVALAEGTNEMVDSTYKGKKFYNGITFHRVIKDFMIQGGDPLGTGSGNPGYRFPDEFVDSLKHTEKGILSMANSGPGTNGSQFFITLKETPWLDGKHTIFGKVVMGQEIVDAIGEVETSKPGDKPVTPITINEVNIIRKGNVNVPSFSKEMETLETERMAKGKRLEKLSTATAVEHRMKRQDVEKLDSGVEIHWLHKGKGAVPLEGSKVLMNYAGYLNTGLLFDTNRLEVAEKFENVDEQRLAANKYTPTETDYSKDARLIPGFREALLKMSIGDKAIVYIPTHLAYGERGYPPMIPANSDLVFELELVSIVSE